MSSKVGRYFRVSSNKDYRHDFQSYHIPFQSYHIRSIYTIPLAILVHPTMGLLDKLKQTVATGGAVEPPGAFGAADDLVPTITSADVNKTPGKTPSNDSAAVPFNASSQSAGAASIDSDKFYPARVGESLNGGKYTVKGQLGTGRYSAVWLVEDMRYGFQSF